MASNVTQGLWGCSRKLWLSRLCFQCCLPLWCDVRIMQLELCRECSGRQQRSDYSFSATTLAVSDTGKGKTQRRSSEPNNLKFLLKYYFSKPKCFSLELGLKFKSPRSEVFHFEENNVAIEALKTGFFPYFVLLNWAKDCFQINPR